MGNENLDQWKFQSIENFGQWKNSIDIQCQFGLIIIQSICIF